MKNIGSILKNVGVEVTDEQIEKINAEVAENYKTINDYNKQIEKIKSLENSVEETTETLKQAQEDLKKFEGVDTDALNNKIKELEETIAKNESDYKSKIEDRDFHDLLEKSITASKGKNSKAIMALLDMEALKGSKNQKEDIASAIKALTEAEDSKMLFGDPEPARVGSGNPIGAVSKGGSGDDFSLHDAIESHYK